jgi:hypothetical protein
MPLVRGAWDRAGGLKLLELITLLNQCSPYLQSLSAGGHHDGVTHAGVTLHKPAKWHTYVGEGMAGLMWFWILYRFYNDYDTFLVSED